MADLRELTTDAKRLYEALDYLLGKQEESNNVEDIDFKEIWFSAKARPFEQHNIGKLEEFEAKRYLLALSGLIALGDTLEKRVIQVRFMARVLASYKKAQYDLKEIINGGLLIEEKNIDELQEIMNGEINTSLVVDLLLMVYLDSTVCEKQLDYVAGIMALTGMDRVTVNAIGNVVKGILEQNDKLILAQSKDIDVTSVYCYMQNPPDGVLVNNLDKAKAVNAEKIIFNGIEWEAIPVINIDEYQADIIEFANCSFERIEGIINTKKKILLTDCSFTDCEVAQKFLCLKNAKISNCKFLNIASFDTKTIHLFVFLDSEVSGTEFKNITIQHNANTPYGGFLKAKNSVFANIFVDSLVTQSNSIDEWRMVIDIYGGRMAGCKFNDCNLSCDSYLFTFSEGAVKNHISIENLISNLKNDFENRSNNRNNYDISFEELFGGE